MQSAVMEEPLYINFFSMDEVVVHIIVSSGAFIFSVQITQFTAVLREMKQEGRRISDYSDFLM